MSTKLRTACDRCHQIKVRCSGDVPCQGCLLSNSLCLYSFSHPLGRPRGTKNYQASPRPSGDNSWNGEALSRAHNTVHSTAMENRTLGKRAASPHDPRSRKNHSSHRSPPHTWNSALVDNQCGDAPDLLRSGNQASWEQVCFNANEHAQCGSSGITVLPTPAVSRTDPFPTTGHNEAMTPRNLTSDGRSDVEMSQLSSSEHSGFQTPITWNEYTYVPSNRNSSQTSLDSQDIENASKVTN